jgi:hypothetical protein
MCPLVLPQKELPKDLFDRKYKKRRLATDPTTLVDFLNGVSGCYRKIILVGATQSGYSQRMGLLNSYFSQGSYIMDYFGGKDGSNHIHKLSWTTNNVGSLNKVVVVNMGIFNPREGVSEQELEELLKKTGEALKGRLNEKEVVTMLYL